MKMTFHNIFSNKTKEKKENKQSQLIIADNREKNSLVISELIALNNKLELKQLEVADYIIGNIAIERKTIADLISSMLSKRLFKQLENLKQYENSLLIVENYSDLNLKDTNLSENALRGLLLSISLDFKIPIIFTKDEKDTAIFLSILAKKKKTELSLRSKIPLSLQQQLQFILEGFPNIGPKTARKLLEKYKTIKNIINTKDEEIKSFLGKKADKFIELINTIFHITN